MTDPLEDENSALHYASLASDPKVCAQWCARAIARRVSGRHKGAQQERVYNLMTRRLTGRLVRLVLDAEKEAEKL